jgi:hypothetical protein
LHDLHLQCAEQAIVIPLWQLVESYAFRKNLSGISKKSSSLYDSVQNWKIVPHTKKSLIAR